MAKDYKDVNPYKEDINSSIKHINYSIDELLEDVENTLDELYSIAYEKGCSDMLNPDLVALWYNQGLIDAWECAKKMVNMSIDDRCTIFNDDLIYLKDTFEKYSASEAIQKIKEYKETKEKQSNSKHCSILKDICAYPNNECWGCSLHYAVESAKHNLRKIKEAEHDQR